MFSMLGWIVFGLMVGALAKLVMPGRDPGGLSSPSCLASWVRCSAAGSGGRSGCMALESRRALSWR